MATEERFGIQISDAESELCQTPALLINLVCSKLPSADGKVCMTQRAFHILRSALMELTGARRSQIRLATRVHTLIPRQNTREVWDKLEERLQPRFWPKLSRPFWMEILLLAGCLTILAAGFIYLKLSLCMIASIVFLIVGYRMTGGFAHHIRAKTSVRDLIRYVATADLVSSRRKDVASVIKEIVIEQLGIRSEQYREDADFVRDLGVG